MNNKIFITRKLPDNILKYLEQHLEITVNIHDNKLSEDEIIQNIEGKQGLICLLNDKITEKIIRSNPDLKIISNFGVGYNNIDIKAAKDLGIMVTNTPGVLDDTTAELALALIFAVSRRVVEADRYVRDGLWKTGWEINLFQGYDIHNKTIGILGFGKIGQSLAGKVKCLDMKILYHNRNRLDKNIENKYQAEYVDKETLFKTSDIISIHTPLTQNTYHLVTEKEISLMKPTAIIINTSRGEVINENDLYQALKNKLIWGAGLDVFENEPIMTNGLIDLKNVVILPHIGSASIETRNKMGMMVTDNIIKGLSGEIPPNLVQS